MGRAAKHPDVGLMLRHWRGVRGLSQLALSLEAGVSQRHVSFIEVGRSVASRQMLVDLATALDMPLRARNALLLAGGFAPVYAEGGWDAPAMEGIHRALDRMLRQHEPFPALVMDRHWNVLRTNAAAPRFFGRFCDLAARPAPRNMLELMFDPAGMRPFVAEFPVVAASLLERVRREAVGRVADEGTAALLARLQAFGDVAAPGGGVEERAAMPMVALGFVLDGVRLDYFSMVTTVGAPQAVAAEELRIESLFPADGATEARHVALFGGEGADAR